MDSRKDGFCDYHPGQEATHLFACASPDEDDIRGRMLCQFCADSITALGSSGENPRYLLDTEPSMMITWFPYRTWILRQIPPEPPPLPM